MRTPILGWLRLYLRQTRCDMAVSSMNPAWPPTIDALMRDISVEADDARDVEELQACLDAAVSFVQRVRPELNYGRVFIGETVLLPFTTGDGSVPTSIALTVTDPLGVEYIQVVGPAIEDGVYSHPFLTTVAGTYVGRWAAVGPVPNASRKAVVQFVVSPLDGSVSPDADLFLGTVRLAARWYARRLTPSALIELGDLGGARVPSFDADIERLLRIGRHRKSVIA